MTSPNMEVAMFHPGSSEEYSVVYTNAILLTYEPLCEPLEHTSGQRDERRPTGLGHALFCDVLCIERQRF